MSAPRVQRSTTRVVRRSSLPGKSADRTEVLERLFMEAIQRVETALKASKINPVDRETELNAALKSLRFALLQATGRLAVVSSWLQRVLQRIPVKERTARDFQESAIQMIDGIQQSMIETVASQK